VRQKKFLPENEEIIKMICDGCGKESADEFKFCPHCGKAFVAKPPVIESPSPSSEVQSMTDARTDESQPTKDGVAGAGIRVGTWVFGAFSAISLVVSMAKGIVPIYLLVAAGWAGAAWYWQVKKTHSDVAKPSAEEPRNSGSSQPTIIVREQGRPSAERQVEPPLALTESIPSESDTDVPTAHKAEEGPPPAGKPDSDGVGWAIFMVCTAGAIFVVSLTLTFNSTPSTPSSSQANVSAAAITPTMLSEAKSGDAAAQFNLGILYKDGQGVPQDFAQAAVWFRKAAEQGDAHAQFCLGALYSFGQGVPQDYAQAAVWYRKAAEQGDAGAQGNLGALYMSGQGVPQDYAQGVAWNRKAAEQGDADAQLRLGATYIIGQGVPQSYEEAYFWFDLAASGKITLTNEDGAKSRDDAASHLTPAVLARVQERARKWFEAHAAK
jgi:TPR repeat protein